MRPQPNTLSIFASPSFTEGMARVLDIGSTLQKYEDAATAREADNRAMLSDWRVTGDDLRVSIDFYGQRIGETSKR